MTHICVSNLTTIGSVDGLSPGRRQAITQTNAGNLLIGPLGTNFSEILIKIPTFSFKKMRLKVLSAKWRPFCLGLHVLTRWPLVVPYGDKIRVNISVVLWYSPKGNFRNHYNILHIAWINKIFCKSTYLKIPLYLSAVNEFNSWLLPNKPANVENEKIHHESVPSSHFTASSILSMVKIMLWYIFNMSTREYNLSTIINPAQVETID